MRIGELTSGISNTFLRAELSEFLIPNEIEKGKYVWFIWTFKKDTKGNVRISGLARNNLRKMVNQLGFRKIKSSNSIVLKKDQIILPSSIEEIKDTLINLTNILDESEVLQFGDKEATIHRESMLEVFLCQQHTAINKSALADYLIELEQPILSDSKNTAYVPFQNGVVCVNCDSIQIKPYHSFDQCVWKDHIKDHDFEFADYSNFMFTKFIYNISNSNQSYVQSLRSIIGYLLHNYFDVTESRCVILVDAEAAYSTMAMGGTGKGLLALALSYVKNLVVLDGKRFLGNNRFLFQQIRPDHQIVHIDDVKSNFDTITLNSVLSDGLIMEKKGVDPIKIAKEKTPKFLISSNAGLKTEGTTRKRRQVIFPLSNYYSRKTQLGDATPIITEHGKAFFGNDWENSDWNMFYSFMIDCIQYYLQKGIVVVGADDLIRMNLKTETSLDFSEFILSHIKYNQEVQTKEFFKLFLTDAGYGEAEIKQRTFSNWLKSFARVYGYEYTNSTNNGVSYFIIKN
jgi:hypothetical protein